jgi:hypothetical protein
MYILINIAAIVLIVLKFFNVIAELELALIASTLSDAAWTFTLSMIILY